MKGNVLIYATCQGFALKNLLGNNNFFLNKFNIPDIIKNFDYIRRKKLIIDNEHDFILFKNADVFIYQPLDDIYGKNSTVYLMQFLKPTCLKISIPYVYNDSLWPFIVAKKGDIMDNWVDGDVEALIVRYTEPIKELMTRGIREDDVLTLFDKNEIDWNFKVRHEILMDYLRNKEKKLDVQIVGFIEQNLSQKRLFMYHSHPAAEILVYITNEILQLMELPTVDNTYPEDYFFSERYRFPTSSVKYFNLKFVSDEERMIADKFYRDKIIELFYGDRI